MKGKRVYADSAASARPFSEAVRAAEEAFAVYANPSAAYVNAGRARSIMDFSRALIADVIGAGPDEIFFTSGGTESNYLALCGAAMALPGEKRRIVAGRIEHASVLEPLKKLERDGFEVVYLEPDRKGFYLPEKLLPVLTPDTGLVTLMSAQNEVGTVEPVEEIGAMLRDKGILFHTDAVQSIGHLKTDVGACGADLMSASAHKFGGIKGAGFLFIRQGTPFLSPFGGGMQEKGVRPGTENIPGIAAMAAALRRAEEIRESENKRLSDAVRRIDETVLALPGAVKTGADGKENRLPGMASYYFPGIDSAALIQALDLFDVDAAAGAACHSGEEEESHVIRAMGYSGGGALRLSLGWDTEEEDLVLLQERVPRAVRLLAGEKE